jgi:hypothetical protein
MGVGTRIHLCAIYGEGVQVEETDHTCPKVHQPGTAPTASLRAVSHTPHFPNSTAPAWEELHSRHPSPDQHGTGFYYLPVSGQMVEVGQEEVRASDPGTMKYHLLPAHDPWPSLLDARLLCGQA